MTSDTLIVRRLLVTSPTCGPLTIDIFPHRMTPRRGADLEDMIFTLLAMLEGQTSEDHFGAHDIGQILASGLDHPYGQYGPGSVVCTARRDAHAAPVRCENGTIILPDGKTYSRRDFSPLAYAPNTATQIENFLFQMQDRNELSPLVAVLLGVCQQLLPLRYVHDLASGPLALGCVLAARAARLVQTTRPASGRQASEAAWEITQKTLRDFAWTWTIMPDRGWMPESFVAGPTFEACLAKADPDLLALGRRLAARLDAEEICGAITERDTRLSNHQQITLKGLLGEIDRAIEDGLPLDRLKPAARKRAARRRA